MLKFATEFTEADLYPQSNPPVNNTLNTGESPHNYSLTPPDVSDTVPPENKKPELGGSGKKAEMTGVELPTILAADHIRLNSNENLIAESSVTRPWTKVHHEEALELSENDPLAFLLLSQISFRALRKDSPYNKHKLKPGQALIGDFWKLAMTEQQYRDVKYRIEFIYKLATFQGTNKGTIATLTSTKVYDINLPSEERTKERTKNEQRTTNQECKNVREEPSLRFPQTETTPAPSAPAIKRISRSRKKAEPAVLVQRTELVATTDSEHLKLVKKFGESKTLEIYDQIDSWRSRSGSSVGNDYLMACKWSYTATSQEKKVKVDGSSVKKYFESWHKGLYRFEVGEDRVAFFTSHGQEKYTLQYKEKGFWSQLEGKLYKFGFIKKVADGTQKQEA